MWIIDLDAGKSDEDRLRFAWEQLEPDFQAKIQRRAGGDVLAVLREVHARFLARFATDPAYRAEATAWLDRQRHPHGHDPTGDDQKERRTL